MTFTPSSLTFTSGNYSTVQNVSFRAAQDDDITDDSATITIAPRVGASRDIDDVSNEDVYPTATERGNGTFIVTLGAPPASSATLSVISDDTSGATVSPATLTFIAANDDTAPEVTVVAEEDFDYKKASRAFTVQVLTRTGGGGALVNNSAQGGVRREGGVFSFDSPSAAGQILRGRPGRKR